MIAFEIRFLAGQFHGTPWDREANEGALEWPPSPWRILRALIASGFGRLGWTVIPDVANRLIIKLAASNPRFRLPEATASHTRHYMPLENGSKTRLTFDTFVQTGNVKGKDELVVYWPTELDADERELLSALLSALPYFGRAESWAEARLLDDVPDGIQANCVPWDEADDSLRNECNRVEVFAPIDADNYCRWKDGVLDRDAEEHAATEASKGKKVTVKALAKWRIAAAEKLAIGSDIVQAICKSPAELNAAGWNTPPGSRKVAYAVPKNALNAPCPPTPTSIGALDWKEKTCVTDVLMTVSSDVLHGERLPMIKRVLECGNVLHKKLVWRLDNKCHYVSTCVTGIDADGESALQSGHTHLHILPVLEKDAPQSRPATGRIGHFLLHADQGFDRAMLSVLHGHLKLQDRDTGINLTLTQAGQGCKEDFLRGISILRESDVWTSATPFMPPRFLKPSGNSSLAGQILSEIASRNLPRPISIEIDMEDGWKRIDTPEGAALFWKVWRSLRPIIHLRATKPLTEAHETLATPERLSSRWRGFVLERSPRRKPKVPCSFGIRLRFDGTVQGPITLGYGSHFGMGLFSPYDIVGRK